MIIYLKYHKNFCENLLICCISPNVITQIRLLSPSSLEYLLSGPFLKACASPAPRPKQELGKNAIVRKEDIGFVSPS